MTAHPEGPARGSPAAHSSESHLTGREPKAVAHALRALEQVALHGPGVTARMISTSLDLSPATTYRLLNALVAEEYIVRLPDLAGFALGRRAIVFAGAANTISPQLSRRARDVVGRVRDGVRWGVHLVLLQGERVLIADSDPEYAPPAEVEIARAVAVVLPGLSAGVPTASVEFDIGSGHGTEWLVVPVFAEDGAAVAVLVMIAPEGRLQRSRDDFVRTLTDAAAELADLLS
jgi:DNA-binding IclR family transcriptional regulator